MNNIILVGFRKPEEEKCGSASNLNVRIGLGRPFLYGLLLIHRRNLLRVLAMNAKTQSMSFDPEALGASIRKNETSGYAPTAMTSIRSPGEFAYFVEDPYIENELTREAIDEEVEVVIIGGVLAECWLPLR